VVQELYDASEVVSQAARKFVNRSSTDSNVLNNLDLTLEPQLIPGTSCESHDVSPRNASRTSSANYFDYSVAVLPPTRCGKAL
jgi:hypothetical protein